MAWLLCEHSIQKFKREFRIRKPITTIGRAPGNDLVLEDPMVSQSHASLTRQGGGYSVAISHRNGEMYVNGSRTKSATLSEGDQILIGVWKITFTNEEKVETGDSEGGSRIELGKLEDLVQLANETMKDTSPQLLFQSLLKGLVKITKAEKGFIIIFQDGQRQVAASHNVDSEQINLNSFSDSIIQQVTEHLKPIIVSDAMADSRFGRAKSVVDLRLSSVMCVPLIYRNDLLGVLYLGNDKITDLFTEQDLQLLRIYSSQASLMIHHAMLLNQLKLDNQKLRHQLRRASQGQIVGSSPPMKQVFKVLRKVSPTDLSVLILGETGTGKELVAREIHQLSDRKDKPFVAINCGAIPENLLESELFGHKKGAFTGAIQDKTGRVEAAGGGTLFLDEIGEMAMPLQVKLLRVLQERVIERVGDLTPRPVDIRVIAATNRDPSEMITEGRFREDLYYRINELSIPLPPLRERGDDIALIAKYFVAKYSQQYQSNSHGLTNQAVTALNNYYWPGNVRELENRIKKAVIMSDRALLNPDDLGITSDDKRHIQLLAEAQEAFKMDYIRRALEINNWNKAQTARDLGVDARTIFRYIEKFSD